MNPVRLVATVLARKSVVHPSSRLRVSRPYTTIAPETIPTKLITTCMSVNVDNVMPKIMMSLLQEQEFEIVPYYTSIWRSEIRGHLPLAPERAGRGCRGKTSRRLSAGLG